MVVDGRSTWISLAVVIIPLVSYIDSIGYGGRRIRKSRTLANRLGLRLGQLWIGAGLTIGTSGPSKYGGGVQAAIVPGGLNSDVGTANVTDGIAPNISTLTNYTTAVECSITTDNAKLSI